MGNTSSKESSGSGTGATKPTTVSKAIESVERQMNYRPAEQDRLQQDLDCLQRLREMGRTKIVVEGKKACNGSGRLCERHRVVGTKS